MQAIEDVILRAAVPGVGELELLEREAELGIAHAVIASAKQGDGATILIEGAPGVGKTCLLRAALNAARTAGLQTTSARASELEREFAFGVVRQLFEPKLTGIPAKRRGRLFAGAAGLAAPLFEATEPGALQQQGEHAQTILHGLYWLTVNLSAEAPLALIIDDAHWADAPSLRFLAYLSNRLDGLPLAVAVATRPLEPGSETELLDELASGLVTRVIRPKPLSRTAVGDLVRDVLGADPDDSFSEACFAATKGNPLFVREVLMTLRAEATAPNARHADAVLKAAPRSVARSVARRLRQLGQDAGELARAVAVLGDGASLWAAAELAQLDPASATRAAEVLARGEIISFDALEFVHPVVRSSVYSELTSAQRTSQHRAAARIRAAEGAKEDEIAAHLLVCEPAGDPWVVDMLRRAARQAHARGAPDIAARLLERALAEPPPAAERVDVLVELGSAELPAMRVSGLDRLREALELADDPVVRANVGLRLGQHLFSWAMFAEAARVFDDALARAAELAPDRREHLEAQRLCVTLVDPSVRSEATEERAMELIERNDELSDPVMLATIGARQAVTVPPARAGAELTARALANGALSIHDAAIPYGAAVVGLISADRLEEAKRIVKEALTDAHRRGSVYASGFASIMRALVLVRLGSIPAAEADARSTLHGLSEDTRISGLTPETRLLIPWVLPAMVDCLVERGELTQATQLLDQLQLAGELPNLLPLNFLLESRARLRLAEGRLQEAVSDLRNCGRRLDDLGVFNPALIGWRANLAVALARCDERDEARSLAQRDVELAEAFEVPRELGIALRAAGLAQGGSEGIELLRQAVTVLERTPARLEQARALTDLGAALRRAGRRADAREPLRRGLDLARRCGATALAERAHGELLSAGARPRRLVLSGIDALTASERRVADLAAEGLTNREIAQALFVTEKTVEGHLAHAYQKLDIGSRSQLRGVLSRMEAVAA